MKASRENIQLIIALSLISIAILLAFTISQTTPLQDIIIVGILSLGVLLIVYLFMPSLFSKLNISNAKYILSADIISTVIIPAFFSFINPTNESKQTPKPVKVIEQKADLEVIKGSFIPVSYRLFEDNIVTDSKRIVQPNVQVRIVYPIGVNELSELAEGLTSFIEERYDASAMIYSIGSYKSAIANQFREFDNTVNVVFLTIDESSFQREFINNLSNESNYKVTQISESDLGDFEYDTSDDIILFLGLLPD